MTDQPGQVPEHDKDVLEHAEFTKGLGIVQKTTRVDPSEYDDAPIMTLNDDSQVPDDAAGEERDGA